MMFSTTERITKATKEECHAIAHALRDRLYELSEDKQHDDISDNGAFDVYMAAQTLDEACQMIAYSNSLQLEYKERQNVKS